MKIIFICPCCKEEIEVELTDISYPREKKGTVFPVDTSQPPEFVQSHDITEPPMSSYEKDPPLDAEPIDQHSREGTPEKPYPLPQKKEEPKKQEFIEPTAEQEALYVQLEQEMLNYFEHKSQGLTFENEQERQEWVFKQVSDWIEKATTMKAYTADYIPNKMIGVVISEFNTQFSKDLKVPSDAEPKEKKRLIGLELAIHFKTQTQEGKSEMSKWLSTTTLIPGYCSLRNIPTNTEGNEKRAQWAFDKIKKKWYDKK